MAAPTITQRDIGTETEDQRHRVYEHADTETEDQSHHVYEHADIGTASSKTSLSQRAPTVPIALRSWHMYLNVGLGKLSYTNVLGQRNECIRSQLGNMKSKIDPFGKIISDMPIGLDVHVEHSVYSTFPYPPMFRNLLEEQRALPVFRESEESSVEARSTPAAASQPDGDTQATTRIKDWGVRNCLFGIVRASVIEIDNQVQPVYVVIGIFPRGYTTPREMVVFVENPSHLFWKLQWAAFRLRGLTRSLFSLRHIKEFRLYHCNPKNGTHERIRLDSNGVADLQLLLDAYKQWLTPNYISRNWAKWIHQVMNNNSHDVLHGSYSLELVLGWSSTRISVVVLLPVLLSLAIGIYLNSSNWSDLATTQTAWGTASFVVTAGGLTAALLGILSSIADK